MGLCYNIITMNKEKFILRRITQSPKVLAIEAKYKKQIEVILMEYEKLKTPINIISKYLGVACNTVNTYRKKMRLPLRKDSWKKRRKLKSSIFE